MFVGVVEVVVWCHRLMLWDPRIGRLWGPFLTAGRSLYNRWGLRLRVLGDVVQAVLEKTMLLEVLAQKACKEVAVLVGRGSFSLVGALVWEVELVQFTLRSVALGKMSLILERNVLKNKGLLSLAVWDYLVVLLDREELDVEEIMEAKSVLRKMETQRVDRELSVLVDRELLVLGQS